MPPRFLASLLARTLACLWTSGCGGDSGTPSTKPNENAALLAAGAVPRKLVAPNAGFNFGLVGLEHTLTVKAGSRVLPIPREGDERPGTIQMGGEAYAPYPTLGPTAAGGGDARPGGRRPRPGGRP